MAHELAHVKNRDTLVMTMTATIAGAISMLANFGMFFGGSRDRNNPLGSIGVILMVILAPLAAMLVQMAISRTREYGADRGGAEISGQPLALASALAKISGAAHQIENPTAEANPATAHMFIINPLSGQRMDGLFSTHPDPRNRIEALQKISQEMGLRRPAHAVHGADERRAIGTVGLSAVATAPKGLEVRQLAASLRGADSPRRIDDRGKPAHGHPGSGSLNPATGHFSMSFCSPSFVTAARSNGFSNLIWRNHFPRKSGPANFILWVGIAELLFLGVPVHAAIDQAVRSARSDRNATHFSGLVNAVLRKIATARQGRSGGLQRPSSQHARMALVAMEPELWGRICPRN